MNAAQMVTHCARALETGTGDRPMKQKFLGKIITPFLRSSILGERTVQQELADRSVIRGCGRA